MALTWTIFPDSNDEVGSIGDNGVIWSPGGVWDAAAGSVLNGQAIDQSMLVYYARVGAPLKYYLARAGMVFNTGIYLPPAMVITSGQVIVNGLLDPFTIQLVDGSGIHEPLVLADYGLLRASVADLGHVTVPAGFPFIVNIPLTALGIAHINFAGKTYFGLRYAWDISGVAPGIFTNINFIMNAKTIDLYGFGSPTVPVIGTTTATISCTTYLPAIPALQVSGPGSGNYSNLDIRLEVIRFPDVFPHIFTPWHDNFGMGDTFTENVVGLVPNTDYTVQVNYRFHGGATVYPGGAAAFKTLPAPVVGTLQIIKNTAGGNGTFTFHVSGGPTSVPDQTITTIGGTGSASVGGITPGTYTVTEVLPPLWHSNDPSLNQNVVVPAAGTGTANYNNGLDAKENLAYPLGRNDI